MYAESPTNSATKIQIAGHAGMGDGGGGGGGDNDDSKPWYGKYDNSLLIYDCLFISYIVSFVGRHIIMVVRFLFFHSLYFKCIRSREQ